MRLRLTEILDYYDVPQIFVALDAVGTQYLCLVHDYDEGGRSLCIAANISKDRLNDVVTGHVDLRQVYLEPEQWLYDVVENGNIIEATRHEEPPTEEMLPEEGYYLDFGKRESQEMIRTAQERRRTVIRIGLNYESNNHVVPISVLNEVGHCFQVILSNGYRKLASTRNAECAELGVSALIAASFDLELIANEPTDLFGSSKVADTLDMLSPLFGEEDEAVASCLTTFKTTQASYKNMLKALSDKNISFKCKWVHAALSGEVRELPVTKERVQNLYTLASNLTSLDEREVTFEGVFFMANTRNGRWGMELADGGKKARYGWCHKEEKLKGVVLHNQVYRITCTERPTQNANTGKIYFAYILTDIQRVQKV